MKKYVAKMYHEGVYRLLAIADSDILNRTFEENGVKIEVKESFYGNTYIKESDIKRMMKQMNTGNFIGVNSVNLAIEDGYVSEKNVVSIGGILHAQYYDLNSL